MNGRKCGFDELRGLLAVLGPREMLWAGLMASMVLIGVSMAAAQAPNQESGAVQAGERVPPPAPIPAKPDRLPSAFTEPLPGGIRELRTIETHVDRLTPLLAPAVVAVTVGNASGSAVVVSPDGLVMTAAHVAGAPGRDVTFTFYDGKTAKGRTLGTAHSSDAGLMQITDPGPWPHVEVAGPAEIEPGDWVLALGHPGGFDAKRPIVLRLGRVIQLDGDTMRTDCTLIGGDSGGPLFDAHGRVVAIHSRISESSTANYHVPMSAFFENWERLARGENWGRNGPERIVYVGFSASDRPNGCEVSAIDGRGPAFRAGLKYGDLITKVNAKPVDSFEAFMRCAAEASPGRALRIELRRDGLESCLLLLPSSGLGRGGRGGFGEFRP